MVFFLRKRVLCLGFFIVIASILGTYRLGLIPVNITNGDQIRIFGNENPDDPLPTETQQNPSQSQQNPPQSDQNVQTASSIGPLTTTPTESVHGFTVFDHLYLRDGTFYVLTSDPSKFPPRRNIVSRPLDLGMDYDLEPTDKELQFLTPENAQNVLGDHAITVGDLSVIIYDPPQFMSHFYHWWGEIILGAWRILSTLERGSSGDSLPPPVRFPARFLMPFVEEGRWRDRAGVDGPLMRAAFPHASIEKSDYWEDLIKLNTTVVFERVMLVNRQAAHLHPYAGLWFKMIAGTMNVTVPDDFWTPVRQSVVQNILGYIPKIDDRPGAKPILTYISRQGSGRRLREEDHEGLLTVLAELEEEGICEVRVPKMELLSLREQIELVAGSTIILGVHGNGLTHQLWMPRSRLSTVFEIFDPRGFLFDYEILARNMGHRHYAVWNDSLLTYPPGTYHEGVNVGEQFQGNSIPVHGPSIAQAIRKRLAET